MKRKCLMLAVVALMGYFSLAAQASVGRDDGGRSKSPAHRAAGSFASRIHEKRFIEMHLGLLQRNGGKRDGDGCRYVLGHLLRRLRQSLRLGALTELLASGRC